MEPSTKWAGVGVLMLSHIIEAKVHSTDTGLDQSEGLV